MDLEEIAKKFLIVGRISGLTFLIRKDIELALSNLEFDKLEEVTEVLKGALQRIKKIEKLTKQL